MELVALPADAARQPGLFRDPLELLQQTLLSLDLPHCVGLEPKGLQLLGPHRHGQLLLLGLGGGAGGLDLGLGGRAAGEGLQGGLGQGANVFPGRDLLQLFRKKNIFRSILLGIACRLRLR